MSDEVIHYGVLGMKWGRRKDKGNSAVSNKSTVDTDSKDAKVASALKTKAKKSGVSSLSNAELKALNERLNLEQNYERMSPQAVKSGKSVAGRIITGVRVVNDIDRGISNTRGSENIPGYNHPMVNLGRTILRTTESAAKYAERVKKY